VAQGYRDALPQPVRDSIHNFFTNLRSPIIMFNDVIQGEGKLAGDTFGRLWLNTILGLARFFDVASRAGIPFHDADFGQTFGVWGVGPGPYLVLPILGPSNPRDGVGMIAGCMPIRRTPSPGQGRLLGVLSAGGHRGHRSALAQHRHPRSHREHLARTTTRRSQASTTSGAPPRSVTRRRRRQPPA